MSKKDYLKVVVDTMIECQALYPDIIVKYLPSINRSQPIAQLKENIDLFIELKNEYPDMVLGVDMSGDPDPNKNKFSTIKPLLEKARNNGFKLALHCAEIEKEDENLEMLEFGMDRIGHGTFFNNTYKTTWEVLMKKRIPIECCLSSNVLCGSVKSMKDHHFQDFFSINYPVCICTDDYGVFDTSLSKELQICAETFDLSKMDVVKICRDSVDFSFASQNEKSLLMKKIDEFVMSLEQ
jgi:adenosine deaminase